MSWVFTKKQGDWLDFPPAFKAIVLSPSTLSSIKIGENTGEIMAKQLELNDILRLANERYTDSHVLKQAATISEGETPEMELARFIATAITDLYDGNSSNNANLERMAVAFEHGSSYLMSQALTLRKLQTV